jgi:hypothetical protein
LLQEELSVLHRIFTTTRAAIEDFMKLLDPAIANAKDEHERLYHHHIYEEEEHRLGRLAELIPLIKKFQNEDIIFSPTNREWNRLLQELNLEKFGLHNFVEHLDLALFQFTDDERQATLKEMRDVSYSDYNLVKELLTDLNSRFDHDYKDPHEHHDAHGDHLAPPQPSASAGKSHSSSTSAAPSTASQSQQQRTRKGFSVGSLIQSY